MLRNEASRISKICQKCQVFKKSHAKAQRVIKKGKNELKMGGAKYLTPDIANEASGQMVFAPTTKNCQVCQVLFKRLRVVKGFISIVK